MAESNTPDWDSLLDQPPSSPTNDTTPSWDDLFDQPPASAKIAYAAKNAGVDPDDAVAIAHFESGLEPTAKNPHSPAHGIFQMMPAAWSDNAPPGADPHDEDDQIAAGINFTAKNQKALT